MKHDEANIQSSILDRLMDNYPGISHEPVQHSLLTIRQIKALVIRDLENLLNSRCPIAAPSAEYTELHKSLFVYGIRDYSALSPKSPSVRQTLRQDIEKSIARFEPRLKNVTVNVEPGHQKGRDLRFRINALLVVEPESEPVTFDTLFDINRGEYIISH